MNPAGGQFSSLSDAIILTQTLLNPRHSRSLLTPYSMDKWLQTVHSFEEDDWTEIGFVWEIIKAADSNGRLRKIYWKRKYLTVIIYDTPCVLTLFPNYAVGAMAGYHSAIAIHPGTSYGVAVFLGGHYSDSAKIAYDALDIFQPAIDAALADAVNESYGGTWSSADGESFAILVIRKGVLWMDSYVLKGVDALGMFLSPGKLALRSTGVRDEFRYICLPSSLMSFANSSTRSNTVWIPGFPGIMARSTWHAIRIGTVKTYGER